ncbi:MAG: glycosyltransferase family 4 protein, partial [Patescibacteria group bacterium]
ITQKVDVRDDVLGFFHWWISEFAKQCDSVTVICLQKGECHLPPNVHILSLGKEEGLSRSKYLSRFYRFVWQERDNYDTVFVHMNPVYIALAGPLWHIWGKKVALWYIHPKADKYLKAAHVFAQRIFTASDRSFPFASPKIMVVGHGIDTERFQPMTGVVKEKNSIVYVGRISPVKQLDILADAARSLDVKGVAFTLHIIGGQDVQHADYYARFKQDLAELERKGRVVYHGPIPNVELPQWYNKYEVLVNTTPTGSFDKTVLEAMACGTLATVSNKSFAEFLPPEFLVPEGNSKRLADVLTSVLSLSDEEKKQYAKRLRNTVVEHHSLSALVEKITHSLS